MWNVGIWVSLVEMLFLNFKQLFFLNREFRQGEICSYSVTQFPKIRTGYQWYKNLKFYIYQYVTLLYHDSILKSL